MGERRERGLSGTVDLHAMDDGSGLLIPIFAMLQPEQDGEEEWVVRTEEETDVKAGRGREKSMDREETRLAM